MSKKREDTWQPIGDAAAEIVKNLEKQPRFTKEQIREIDRMHRSEMSWTAIGKYFGCSRFTVRNAIYPEYGERMNQLHRARRVRIRGAAMPKDTKIGRRPAEIIERPIAIPEGVLIDRERRYSLAPHCLTAALQGDPLPGMSAWDKRQKQTA